MTHPADEATAPLTDADIDAIEARLGPRRRAPTRHDARCSACGTGRILYCMREVTDPGEDPTIILYTRYSCECVLERHAPTASDPCWRVLTEDAEHILGFDTPRPEPWATTQLRRLVAALRAARKDAPHG